MNAGMPWCRPSAAESDMASSDIRINNPHSVLLARHAEAYGLTAILADSAFASGHRPWATEPCRFLHAAMVRPRAAGDAAHRVQAAQERRRGRRRQPRFDRAATAACWRV